MALIGHNQVESNTDQPNDEIQGVYDTTTVGGYANNIIVRIGLWDSGDNVKCAIYRSHDRAFIAETEERSTGGSTGWYTFNFTSRPRLDANTEYIIVGMASETVYFYYGDETGYTMFRNLSNVYENGFPDPLGSASDTSDYAFSIYCNYDADDEKAGNLNIGNGASRNLVLGGDDDRNLTFTYTYI